MEMTKEQINKMIDSATVISFDIFDTLIMRLVNRPEDTFLLIEKYFDLPGFEKKRIKAQHKASKKQALYGHAHANYDEIYEELEKLYHEKRSVIERVKVFEVELEQILLRPRTIGKEMFEYALSLNKRVILISDMYLNLNTIENFLTESGYSGYHKIYLSSEKKVAKSDGKLYRCVLQEEKISSNQILHIGDSYRSDKLMAESLGIKCIHLPLEQERNHIRNQDIYDLVDSGIYKYIRENASGKSKDFFWNELGIRTGGRLYKGLITWINEEINHSQARKILFMARDGYLLNQLSQEKNIYSCSSEYFITSRRALLLPAMDNLDADFIAMLPPYRTGQKVSDIVQYLDIEINLSILNEHGFENYDSIIKNKQQIAQFKNMYYAIENQLKKKAVLERTAFKIYLETLGVNKQNLSEMLFFDIGWNGSSQILLSKVLKNLEWDKSPNFLYLGLNETSKLYSAIDQYGFKVYMDNLKKKSHENLMQANMVAELLFTSDSQSLLCYSLDEEYDGYRYIYSNNISEDFLKIRVREINFGIMTYFQMSSSIFSKLDVKISPEIAFKPLKRLIMNPTFKEADEIGSLFDFNSSTASSIQKEYIAPRFGSIKEIIQTKGQTYWYNGSIKRTRNLVNKAIFIMIHKIRNLNYLNSIKSVK